MNRKYAFSVKYNSHKGFLSDQLMLIYQEWISNARDKGCNILSYYYEYDSRNVLHIHGTMEASIDLSYKSLLCKGFGQQIVKVYDSVGWEKYCKKDQEDDDDLEKRARRGEYLFVD